MASILTLPPELSQQILGQLRSRDKVRLSATCKEFRAYLVPETFATIRFSSEKKSADAALAAVKAKGEYTTHIEFTRKAYSDKFPTLILPPAASKLLAGRYMPNMHAAKIYFDFDFRPSVDNEDYRSGFPRSVYDKTHSQTVKFLNWQAKEHQTWRALSMNQHIKALTVNCLNPATTFDFLAHLESAIFTIYEVLDNEICDETIHISDYLDFFEERMDSMLFSHMHSLKHL